MVHIVTTANGLYDVHSLTAPLQVIRPLNLEGYDLRS